jgi:hypothetical protein
MSNAAIPRVPHPNNHHYSAIPPDLPKGLVRRRLQREGHRRVRREDRAAAPAGPKSSHNNLAAKQGVESAVIQVVKERSLNQAVEIGARRTAASGAKTALLDNEWSNQR